MFKSFCKKELIEIIRNYKLFIILIAFASIGFSNPIFAKLTPEIIAATGYDINIPEPTLIDSWLQFYKNIPTLLILFIILFSSALPNELNSNSLINMLTRGLPRRIVILAKFTVISLVWVIAYYITFSITYFYSPLLLTGDLSNLWLAGIYPLLFGILMIALSILGSVITKRTVGGILLPLGGYAISSILSIFDSVQNYMPTMLMSSMQLVTDQLAISDFYAASLITICLIIISLWSSVLIFNNQSI